MARSSHIDGSARHRFLAHIFNGGQANHAPVRFDKRLSDHMRADIGLQPTCRTSRPHHAQRHTV